MTVKQFTEENNVSLVQVILDYNLIINLVVGETPYGIDMDTSDVPTGTTLTDVNDFVISGNFLEAGGIVIDMTQVNMLDS